MNLCLMACTKLTMVHNTLKFITVVLAILYLTVDIPPHHYGMCKYHHCIGNVACIHHNMRVNCCCERLEVCAQNTLANSAFDTGPPYSIPSSLC